ncbi:M48 family metallopeptidase [Deinococcus arenicola]|uniref:SprT family zinc-dependent metalloprotease n=1 Tax=Deinococcus arenicola TaxID=2994950 RepID=A0ABU4DWT0_9DEIO|nr:SprT family zinc-dependent metalloprotease [Deinococcus sp. ZS9-10]MDV6376129.1 SprT family zinc-dependent metalloprotease [Deinococcus sp. ZS9-10]
MPVQPSPQWIISGVPVTVRQSTRRRTVALQVRPGAVTIYAPVRVPLAQLRQMLDERQAWVELHLAQYAARPAAGQQYMDGAALPFLGERLTLRVDDGRKKPVRVGADLFVPAGGLEQAVEAWTRTACLTPYTALVMQYAELLGAANRLRTVRVSGAATRWGSCSSGGDIRLHWRLSRAPLDALHYVALHEAAHLLEMNHSPRYWAHVSRVMPGWQAQRNWLREHGQTL